MRRRADSTIEVAEGVYGLSLGLIAGNVYFVRSESSWVLVDASVEKRAQDIRDAAAALFGPGVAPEGILITHVHPDHTGGAPALAREWDCPVWVPRGEMALSTAKDLETIRGFANPLDRWMILPIMRMMGRKRVAAILAKQSLEAFAQPIDAGDEVPGLLGWKAILSPGHSPGHLVYFRESDRVLISGDAVLTVDAGSLRAILAWLFKRRKPRISRPARYTNWDHRQATATTVALAEFEPRVLAPGHGLPMIGDDTAAALSRYAERWRRSG